LNLILDKDFLNKSKKINIKSIDNLLYNKLNNEVIYIDNNIISYNNGYIPYMCGTFLENKDVDEFRSLPFHDNIYDYLNELLFQNHKSREFVKGNVMRYLNLKKYRENNLFIRKMKEFFPSVDGMIETINGVDESRGCLSILLQRFESYLLLDIGAKEVLKKIPEINFFTIHDSMVVEEQFAEIVRNILSDIIHETTGKKIGFKIKQYVDPFEKIDVLVTEIWNKSSKKIISIRRKRIRDEKINNK
jgi:hypothetical protein